MMEIVNPLARGPSLDTDEESSKKNGEQNSVNTGPTFDKDEGPPSKKKGEQKSYMGSPNAQEERLRKLLTESYFDDLTPECFQGDDVDTKADTTLFLSWTAKNKETQDNISALASGDNSREAKGQAALQALKEQQCVIDPESKYRKAWDVSQISYV